jgi:hypothetical protein
MKKITLIISILVVFSLGFNTGCSKDFLETKPTSSLASPEAMNSLAGCFAAVNGIHRLMYSQVGYGTASTAARQSCGGQSMSYMIADNMGEDMVMHDVGGGWFQGFSNWTSHLNDANADLPYLYTYLYQMIGNANMILAHIDEIEVLTTEEARRDMIKGQALAYRAWGLYQAVQFFADRYVNGGANTHPGVPMPLKPTYVPIARSTVAEVYTQINSDLDNAITLLTGNSAVPTHKSHFRSNTVHGLKARVALTQGNWAIASEHAEKAYTGRSLATAEQLLDGFYQVSNPDWIWASEHIADQPTHFFSFFAFLSLNFNSSQIRTGPRKISAALYNMMDTDDARRDWWLDLDTAAMRARFPNLHSDGFALPRYGIYKWRTHGLETSTGTSNSDLVHMRASEMYLIKAEAEARLGNDATAQVALTKIMEIRVQGFATTNTGQALIDEIMINRRIELWGEGQRWFDVKRLNEPMQRTAAQGWTSSFAGSKTFAPNSIAANDPTEWKFKFPRREATSNPLLEQN